MRYCATVEIKKATQEIPKKSFLDLVFLRSLRNQMRDQGVRIKNYAVIYGGFGSGGFKPSGRGGGPQ